MFSRNPHDCLLEIFDAANRSIEKYFSGDDEGKVILQTIRENLKAFNDQETPHEASLLASKAHLKAIVESLSLNVSEMCPGLGELNLLFIAAELKKT